MQLCRYWRKGRWDHASRMAACLGVLFFCVSSTAWAAPQSVELALDNRTLLANLNVVEGKGKDVPIVVMVHGTFAHKDMELMTTLQTALDERGVHSLAISLSYRQDKRKGARDCKLPITDTYEDGRAEIAAWIKWVNDRGYTKVLLLGHSRGGARVADYLSQPQSETGLAGAVLLAPATEAPKRFIRDFRGSFSGQEITAVKAMFDAAPADKMFDLPGFLYCRKVRASAAAIRSYYGDEQQRDTPTLLKQADGYKVLVVAAGADTVVKGLPEKIAPLVERDAVTLMTVEDADHMFLDFFAEDAADLTSEFAGQ